VNAMAGGLWALSERNAGERRSTYGAERPSVSLISLWRAFGTLRAQRKRPEQPRGHKRALPRKARVVRRSGEGGGWGERSGSCALYLSRTG